MIEQDWSGADIEGKMKCKYIKEKENESFLIWKLVPENTVK